MTIHMIIIYYVHYHREAWLSYASVIYYSYIFQFEINNVNSIAAIHSNPQYILKFNTFIQIQLYNSVKFICPINDHLEEKKCLYMVGNFHQNMSLKLVR